MKQADFVHLHNHSEFSLLDGALRFKPLLETAVHDGMRAVAITDHGNMFGAVSFYRQAMEHGVKPILGCEVYVASGDRRDRNKPAQPGIPRSYHLILLAENSTGYRNLLELVSKGYLEGFYYEPRVDHELLAEHSEGVIALSSCLRGEVPHHLMVGNEQRAGEAAARYREIFGADSFFLELQSHGIEEQIRVNEGLINLSKKLEIPLVATNDCHYLKQEDSRAHDVLLCIGTGTTLDDPHRLKYATDQFYFKSAEEMKQIFSDTPEAIRNTVEIAERISFRLRTKEHHMPEYEIPANLTREEFFEKVVRDGFDERKVALEAHKSAGTLRNPITDYEDRLKREIEIITSMGFAGYFLIVWDFIRFARKSGIPVGPGRGSGAGSLVAYCLRITDVDPLRYQLLFERFLNPERVTMPDFDIDFCMKNRGDVIEYVTHKYGRENVSQIITFGTMAARGSIRDVGRVLNVPYADVDRIAKMIPAELDATIDKALASVTQLADEVKNDERVAEVIEIARKLEGIARHASTHAAGVVIAPRPITEFVPLYKSSKDEITTQFAMNDIESIGLLKMDFLGLRTLTVIKEAVDTIKLDTGHALDLENLPLKDPDTYTLFSKGQTSGVFQFESSGMKELLRKFQPDRFEDLVALNSLYRPGPLGSKMVDDYIDRRHGKVKIAYPMPQLEEHLQETYGVILYQEQVMSISSSLAGFTLGEADLLRRAMGKKKKEVMAAQEQKFIKGCAENGISKKQAKEVFKLMAHFAGYGFNKSHSTAYALLAFQTAYLKAHYPTYFMAALLNGEMESTEKLVTHLGDCRDMGIEILPPDLFESDLRFRPQGAAIRFGLAAIKNAGEGAIEAILRAREKVGRFHSIFELVEEVDLRVVNKRVIEALVKSGAFDVLGWNRRQLAESVDRSLELAQAVQRHRRSGQQDLFLGTDHSQTGDVEPPDVDEWPEAEKLRAEKEALGFYLSGHPLNPHRTLLNDLGVTPFGKLSSLTDRSDTLVAGLVAKVNHRISKKTNEAWANVRLDGLDGDVELLVFSKTYKACYNTLTEDAGVLVQGIVTQEEDRVRVIAREVIPLEDARQKLAKDIEIVLDASSHPPEVAALLRGMLEEHSGNCAVRFRVRTADGNEVFMRPNASYRVAATAELIADLESLVGAEGVRVRSGGKRNGATASDPPFDKRQGSEKS